MPNIPSISSQKIFADIVSVFQYGQITPATFALTQYMNHQRMNDGGYHIFERRTVYPFSKLLRRRPEQKQNDFNKVTKGLQKFDTVLLKVY